PVAPRWHRDHRRWLRWHHRRPPGPAWAGYPAPPPAGAAVGGRTLERGGAFGRVGPSLAPPAPLPPTAVRAARPPGATTGAGPPTGPAAAPSSVAPNAPLQPPASFAPAARGEK